MRPANVVSLVAVHRDLARLEERFRKARESYDELRDACETRVCRWQWANGPTYSLDPLFFLDSDIRVGQFSLAAPANPARWTAYGFSGDDKLLAERQYTELESRQYYEGFYIELADRTIGYLFHHEDTRSVINCSQLVTDGYCPLYFQRWGVRGWVSYKYACTAARVDSFVGVSKEPDEPEQEFSGQVVYGKDGTVELWTKERRQQKGMLSFRGKFPVTNPFLRPPGQLQD